MENKKTGFISTEDKVKAEIYDFCEAEYLTYSALCTAIGINKNILYPFMAGKRSITLSTLEKIELYIYEYRARNKK